MTEGITGDLVDNRSIWVLRTESDSKNRMGVLYILHLSISLLFGYSSIILIVIL